MYSFRMAFVLTESLRIEAPVARVWDVICDLDAYPDWNPFVVAASSSLVPGAAIEMRVRLIGRIAQPQRETVFACVPRERLVYGLDGRLVRSRRGHELAPEGPAATRYTSDFRLDGPLQPLVRSLLGRRLEHGFTAMTAALKLRAEQLEHPAP